MSQINKLRMAIGAGVGLGMIAGNAVRDAIGESRWGFVLGLLVAVIVAGLVALAAKWRWKS